MTWYPSQPRDQIFLKCYGFLSFCKIISEKIGKNINYSSGFKHINGTTRISDKRTAADPNNRDKNMCLKTAFPITACISKINNTWVDNPKYIDVVMAMYNLIENSDIIEKHVEIHGNKTLNNRYSITYFPDNNDNNNKDNKTILIVFYWNLKIIMAQNMLK